MKQTVCDACKDHAPLDPQTGMYVLIVRKILEDREDGSQKYREAEYDICGGCMAKMRKILDGKM